MMSTDKSTLISYKLHGGHAYGILESADGEGETVITVSPRISGFALIGAFTHELTDGVCRPDLRMLEDGEHTVSFHTDGAVISADKIVKDGHRIGLEEKGEDELKRLRSELISVLDELERVNGEISKIYHKINNVSIL